MVTLSASIISAIGLFMLFRRLSPPQSLFIGAILGALLLFETLPEANSSTKIIVPEYVNLLKSLPEKGGIIDTINPEPVKLYYQTIHEKPMEMDIFPGTQRVSIKNIIINSGCPNT